MDVERSQRNEQEMNKQEQEQRQKDFRESIKLEIWGKFTFTVILGLILFAYFVEVQVQYVDFRDDLKNLIDSLPQFLNRYRYSMLSYSLARERILNNNSLSSFEQDSLFGYDLDLLYLDKSIELETNLTSMKSNYP